MAIHIQMGIDKWQVKFGYDSTCTVVIISNFFCPLIPTAVMARFYSIRSSPSLPSVYSGGRHRLADHTTQALFGQRIAALVVDRIQRRLEVIAG